MFRIEAGSSARYCDGLSRRSFVQLGVAGMTSASLAATLQAKELSAARGLAKKNTSVILLWLDGGPSHLDLYDMKPEAPPEVRGLWNPISTNVPGLEITELFPLQAQVADKFSIVRSLHHDNGDHYTAGHWMLTGRGGNVNGSQTSGKHPFFGSIATKMLGARQTGMPPYAAVPYASSIGLRPGYFGGNYLGPEHNPFETEGDPNASNFQVQNLSWGKDFSVERLADRRSLLARFDTLRREIDSSGKFEALNQFERQAYELVTGERARVAFDLNREPAAMRERYGRNSWGQSVLLARRLVEAGSTFVTCFFGGWDQHWDLRKSMNNFLPRVDQCVAALFSDLAERGLYDQVLVVLMGEFSRTPRMNDGGNGGAAGSMGEPGRDHWGNSMFCLLGGGGVQGGRIIGSTDRKGEAPQDRPVRPGDIHHTIYKVLGVDPQLQFLDHGGRPTIAIDHGAVIEELF